MHASQLQVIGFPPSLIPLLEQKLRGLYNAPNGDSINDDVGFQIVEEEYRYEGTEGEDCNNFINRRRNLISSRPLEVAGDVFIVEHVITFPDSELPMLKDNLKNNPVLCDRLSQMIFDRRDTTANTEDQAGETDYESNTVTDAVDSVRVDEDLAVIDDDDDGAENTCDLADVERTVVATEAVLSSSSVEYLTKTLWQYLGCYYYRDEYMWYLMDEVGCAIDHADEPNVACYPFMYCCTQPDGRYEVIPCSLLWPLIHIDKEEVITRDFIPTVSQPKDRAVRLIDWFPDIIDSTVKQAIIDEAIIYNQLLLERSIESSSSDVTLLLDHHHTHSSKLPAIQPCEGLNHIRVFCPWSIDGPQSELDPQRLLHPTGGLSDPTFQLVHKQDDADIIWAVFPFNDNSVWTHPTMRSDHSSLVLINQFPYEGAFVMKDHLAREIARTIGSPSWWSITYDLEVSLAAFVGDYLMRERMGRNNIWIVKPSDGARSKGHIVTDSLLRIIRSLETKTSRVAQKYIEYPLLWKGRKFDMRFIAMLRSTDPLELYVYNRFWVRVANEQYRLNDIDNKQAVFTAMHLLDGVKPKELYPDYQRFSSGLEEEYQGVVIWSQVLTKIHHMILSLFSHVSKGQKHQMRCDHARAIYGCDVILEK